jgi:hypothetical protein
MAHANVGKSSGEVKSGGGQPWKIKRFFLIFCLRAAREGF